MHVVIYFGIESKSQTANSDIDLQVCNLYLCRILNSKIKLPRGNVSIVAFFILKKIPKFFLLAFVKLISTTLISVLAAGRRPSVSQSVTILEAAVESKKAKIEGKHST